MFTINNYAYENCGKKCRNPDHGDRITRALMKNSLNDERLAAFVAKTCKNFAHVLDNQGQSALHIAAATHKYAIVEWLINYGSDVNLCDKRSGQTPLHRAINYGYFDIALLLLQYGANLEINDLRLKAPIQYCCKPKNYLHEQSSIKEKNQAKEILVWGTNRNYNLGLEDKEGKLYPHYLDYFMKRGTTIKSMSLSRYHCLYIDERNELWVVGLGDGGRLGTNNETTIVLPKKIYIPGKHKTDYVTAVSAAKDHSIALTSTDRLFTCGLNKYGQLGQSNATIEKSLCFREVDIADKNFIGIIAKDCFSLAYTCDSIYIWGINGGQFGMPANEERIVLPRKLPTFSHNILHVSASSAAIVCFTATGLLLLYTKFKVKTIKSPISHEGVKHIAIRGGDFESSVLHGKATNEPLEIIVLTAGDSVFLWCNDIQKYVRCIVSHPITLQRIDWCGENLIVTSLDGTIYKGSISRDAPKVSHSRMKPGAEEFVEQKSSRRLDVCENNAFVISLARVPNIDRVTDISIDQYGESFVILQESSKRYLSVPVLAAEPISLKSLLNQSTDCDRIHDIVFHVEDEVFPAHKYIIYSRAEGLRDIIQQYTDKDIYLNYEGLTSKMFELILKYIYEDYELTLTDIEDVETSFDPYSGLTNLDIYTIFREYMGKFGVSKFFDRMMNSMKNKSEPLQFNRLNYPELYDVRIKCANNTEIRAHRCILITRLEYFNLMFNNSWSESTQEEISLTTVPREYMEPIINFLYHNDENSIRKEQYTETFLYHLLEVCDQFFVNRLKNIIEIMMIEKITLRKCAEMFEFACIYNCSLLQVATLDYISQNMGRLLENHCLDALQSDSLELISQHYKQVYKFSSNNRMSVSSDCLTDDEVLNFVENFQIDLNYRIVADSVKQLKEKTKKAERVQNERRLYEKEAMNLVKNLSIEPESMESSKKLEADNAIIAEAEQISKAIQAQAAKWTKVADKKEITKKKGILAGLKSNDILKYEPKDKDNFTPLKNTSSIAVEPLPVDTSNSSVGESSGSVFNLSLGDFTPQKAEKMSQKQRKRQLSQSDNLTQNQLTADEKVSKSLQLDSIWMPSTSSPSSSHLPIEDQNVWKIKSPSAQMTPSDPINIKPSATSSPKECETPNSFFSPSSSTSHNHSMSKTPSLKRNGNSFTKILQDERRQKEYFNKMKSKSLLLTQMEEAAISELKKFYNVENVFDEYIEIERKMYVPAVPVNFSTWKHE